MDLCRKAFHHATSNHFLKMSQRKEGRKRRRASRKEESIKKGRKIIQEQELDEQIRLKHQKWQRKLDYCLLIEAVLHINSFEIEHMKEEIRKGLHSVRQGAIEESAGHFLVPKEEFRVSWYSPNGGISH
jgi:hypothetical protein